LLSQLGFHEVERLTERLRPLGLHPRHFGLLTHIATAAGQSQQALSGALGVHRTAMVALVDDLEARGLVERRRDPRDRRAYALHLTRAAAQLLADASGRSMRTRQSCSPRSTSRSAISSSACSSA